MTCQRRRAAIALTGAALLPSAALAQTPAAKPAEKEPELDAPYVPTPQDVVDRMLELAKVTAEDYVMDLGCGDGRILVTAAQKFGALIPIYGTLVTSAIALVIAVPLAVDVAARFNGAFAAAVMMRCIGVFGTVAFALLVCASAVCCYWRRAGWIRRGEWP